MKKLIAMLLVFSLCFTVLCACKKDGAQDGGAAENNSTAAEETTIDITTLENYYQDLTPPEVVDGAVTHKLYQAWWDEGELIIQLYIINGMDAPIYDLFIEEMFVYNEEGQIAQAALGPLGIDPIEPKEAFLETFYFGHSVDLPDAELSSLSIDCVIDFIYD